jgi:hypothetical protein
MYKENKVTRKNTRSVDDINSPASKIINTAEENNEDDSQSGKAKREMPFETRVDEAKSKLREEGLLEEPTDDEAVSYMNNKVNITYKDSGGGPFFDYSFSFGSCYITINTAHIFYQKFFAEIENTPEMKTAFELLIAAFVKTIDERTSETAKEVSDVIVQEWNVKLRRYINEQYGFGK